MLDFKLISADCHVAEHPDAWELARREYGDRAPRVVENPQGLGKGLWIMAEGMKPMRSAYFALGYVVDKHRKGESVYENATHFKEIVTTFLEEFRYEDYPQGWEPAAYVAALDRDNIEAAQVFSSWTRINYLQTDAKYQRSVFRAYNEWILEFASYAPKRLFPVPLISILDIDLAVADMREYVKRGCKTVHLPTTIEGDKYYHERYEPLWATATDLDIPLSVHSGSSQGKAHDTFGDQKRAYDPRDYVIRKAHDASAGAGVAWEFISNLIFSGVFDRHPSLKVACIEFGVGEAASVFDSIDYLFVREATTDPEKSINKRYPSEYLRENVFFGFEDDPVAVKAATVYGEDNYLWGSDFPHHTTTYPHSTTLLEGFGDGMDPAILRKMGRDNANRLYGFV